MIRKLASIVLVVLALIGCTDLFAPQVPDGTIPLRSLPAEYAGWWELAERCSGLSGDLAAVEWRVVPGEGTIPGTDGAAGSYYSRGHHIVLMESRVYTGNLVRHEMLHALRRAPGHPRREFVESCGGLVSCGGACLVEANRTGPPKSSAPIVAASSLDVKAEVRPEVVHLSTDTQGCVTIVVNIRNIRNETVRAKVEGPETIGWSVKGFGGGSGGGPVQLDSLLVLAPGATRSHAFDCPRLIAEGLEIGNYRVQGRVGSTRSEGVPLQVVP